MNILHMTLEHQVSLLFIGSIRWIRWDQWWIGSFYTAIVIQLLAHFIARQRRETQPKLAHLPFYTIGLGLTALVGSVLWLLISCFAEGYTINIILGNLFLSHSFISSHPEVIILGFSLFMVPGFLLGSLIWGGFRILVWLFNFISVSQD